MTKEFNWELQPIKSERVHAVYFCDIDSNTRIAYGQEGNGLGIGGGQSVSAYVRSNENPDDLELITHMMMGRIAIGVVPESQARYSHASASESDERAKILARIADRIGDVLPAYEAHPQVSGSEIATLQEVLNRASRFREGQFTEDDRKLFWGYDSRWSGQQVPL